MTQSAAAETRRLTEVEHYAALKEEVGALKVQLSEMSKRPTLSKLAAEKKEAARRGYVCGQHDGYQQGVFDALCPLAPNHTAAVAAYHSRIAP